MCSLVIECVPFLCYQRCFQRSDGELQVNTKKAKRKKNPYTQAIADLLRSPSPRTSYTKLNFLFLFLKKKPYTEAIAELLEVSFSSHTNIDFANQRPPTPPIQPPPQPDLRSCVL